MTQRTSRLDELLREEITRILARDVQDPRIGFVTVTGVDVAPDLRHATVSVSVIGDEKTRRETLRALQRSMPFVRHQLGELRLKRIPEFHVEHDDSIERGTRVLRLLDELEQGTEPEAIPEGETLPAPAGRAQGEAALPIPAPEGTPPKRAHGPRGERRGPSRSGKAGKPAGGRTRHAR